MFLSRRARWSLAALGIASVLLTGKEVAAPWLAPFHDGNERRFAMLALGKFICLVNELAPLYHLLRASDLPIQTILLAVERCELAQGESLLTLDGRFLSSFFVKNCDNWENGRQFPTTGECTGETCSALGGPRHLILNRNELAEQFPHWLWDARLNDPFERIMNRTGGDLTSWVAKGHEEELAQFPIFSIRQSTLDPQAPKWRLEPDAGGLDIVYNLSHALEYKPGGLWIEPEIWVNRKGHSTKFHYDYDPHVVVFQVYGSRRFRILRPASGLVEYDPEEVPMDYGTRWGHLNPSDEALHLHKMLVIDLEPRDVLVIRNGWPHDVTYTDDSIAYSVRSYTQCEALSLWLGERLCRLSAALGTRRICFDDESYREHGAYLALEGHGAASLN